MTNFERYKEQLLNFIGTNSVTPAKVEGEFEKCSDIACTKCDFHSDNNYCDVMLIKWLYEDDDKAECCENCTHFDTSTVRESMCEVCNRNYSNQFKPKPKKTRQSEFLKKYPNANVSGIQPCSIDKENSGEYCSKYDWCSECVERYWSQEVE